MLDCKSLAPIWETVAQDFAAEPSVLIAKVDAEAENSKATANSQGVKSYPTIKFFPRGSTTPEDYAGGRTEKNLVDFLNLKTGTHRAVGGGLDAKAGTIDTLDVLASKLAAGENIDSVSAEAQKVAANMKDKYAEYYVKVFDKLGQSQGYVEKELARLRNLLKKGGLAPEKLDDLTSRSNILQKFMTSQGAKEEL